MEAKKFLRIVALIGGLVALFFVAVSVPQHDRSDSVQLSPYETRSFYLGSGVVHAEVADDPETRALGLSNRESIAPDAGMLFVFDSDNAWGIWMKRMRFPIDIIWLDREFTVVHMVERVAPDTYPEVFTPPVPSRYVLEVPSGTIERNSVKLGETLTEVGLSEP